jgi:hypothetical protein
MLTRRSHFVVSTDAGTDTTSDTVDITRTVLQVIPPACWLCPEREGPADQLWPARLHTRNCTTMILAIMATGNTSA